MGLDLSWSAIRDTLNPTKWDGGDWKKAALVGGALYAGGAYNTRNSANNVNGGWNWGWATDNNVNAVGQMRNIGDVNKYTMNFDALTGTTSVSDIDQLKRTNDYNITNGGYYDPNKAYSSKIAATFDNPATAAAYNNSVANMNKANASKYALYTNIGSAVLDKYGPESHRDKREQANNDRQYNLQRKAINLEEKGLQEAKKARDKENKKLHDRNTRASNAYAMSGITL